MLLSDSDSVSELCMPCPALPALPIGTEAAGRGCPAYSRGVIDDHALVSRGMTLTVAERARAPIIGLRYGLPWYFAR